MQKRKYQYAYDLYCRTTEDPVSYRKYSHRIVVKNKYLRDKVQKINEAWTLKLRGYEVDSDITNKDAVYVDEKNMRINKIKVDYWFLKGWKISCLKEEKEYMEKENIKIIDESWDMKINLTSRQKRRIKGLTDSKLFTFFRKKINERIYSK